MRHQRVWFGLFASTVLIGGCSQVSRKQNCPPIDERSRTISCAPTETSWPAETDASPALGSPTEIYQLGQGRLLKLRNWQRKAQYCFLDGGRLVKSVPVLDGTVAVLVPVSHDEGGETNDLSDSLSVPLDETRNKYVVVREDGAETSVYKIFRVGQRFPEICKLSCRSSMQLVFSPSGYRFECEEQVPGFGANACAVKVILRFKNNKLALDRVAMRKSLPTNTQTKMLLRSIRERFKGPNDIPIDLFDTVFAFYYSGEVKKARRFLKSACLNTGADSEFWWKFVKDQIKQSSFGNEFECRSLK